MQQDTRTTFQMDHARGEDRYDDVQTVQDSRGRGLLESLSRSVADSFRRGYEAPALPPVSEQRLENADTHLGRTGYLVMAICGYFNFLVCGVPDGMGVLYVPLLREFNSSSAETGLVQSLTQGVAFGGSIVTGILVTQFGPGPCAVLGSVMATAGCVVSSFAQSVSTLIVTVGLVSGFGLSLMMTSGWGVISLLSNSLPRFASSVAITTSALGMTVFPPLYSALQDAFDWRGAYLVMGCLCLACLPGAVFLWIISRHRCLGTVNKTGKLWSNIIRPELFKNWRYVVYAATVFLYFVTIWTPIIFVVDVAVDLGLDIETGSLCITLFGTLCAVSRLLAPIFEVFKIPGLVQSAIFVILNGLAAAAIPLATDRTSLLSIMSLCGFFYGPAGLSMALVTLDEMGGQEIYTVAFGYAFGMCGLGELISGPIGGAVRDITGKYDLMFYSCGVVGLVCGATQLFLVSSCWRCSRQYQPLYRRSVNPVGTADPECPSDRTPLLNSKEHTLRVARGEK